MIVFLVDSLCMSLFCVFQDEVPLALGEGPALAPRHVSSEQRLCCQTTDGQGPLCLCGVLEQMVVVLNEALKERSSAGLMQKSNQVQVLGRKRRRSKQWLTCDLQAWVMVATLTFQV